MKRCDGNELLVLQQHQVPYPLPKALRPHASATSLTIKINMRQVFPMLLLQLLRLYAPK